MTRKFLPVLSAVFIISTFISGQALGNTITPKEHSFHYSVSENGLSEKNSKKKFEHFNKEVNYCTDDNSNPYTGNVIINDMEYRFESGFPVSSHTDGTDISFYDENGKKINDERKLKAVHDFISYYNKEETPKDPIYETNDIRDLFSVMSAIGELTGNAVIKGNNENLIETFVYEENDEDTTYFLNITNPDNIKKYKDMKNTSDMLLNTLSEKIGSETDPFKISEIIHDYIIENYHYDYEKASYLLSGGLNTSSLIDITCIEKGIICQDYASLYAFLCKLYGIETDVIIGTDNNGMGHAWNKTIINGTEYYTDVTWDDEEGTDKWFMIDKNRFSKDHIEKIL